MEQKLKRIYVMPGLAVLALAAFFLRKLQPEGKGGALVWVSVLAVLAFAAYAWFLLPRKSYKAGNGGGLAVLIPSLGAAALALVAALQRLTGNGKLLSTALLAATALCWAVIALQRQQGKLVSVWFFIIPTVFFGVELVDEFRSWGTDPQILDYCYELLALIATMCASFHMGGFCFEKGQRRQTVFFCLCGVFFSAAALADAAGNAVFIRLAVILWLGANLWQLLRPGRSEKNSDA